MCGLYKCECADRCLVGVASSLILTASAVCACDMQPVCCHVPFNFAWRMNAIKLDFVLSERSYYAQYIVGCL